jgi:hypothetical protein
VTDQQAWRPSHGDHRENRGYQVTNAAAESTVGEVTAALTETSEIESQDSGASRYERPGDPYCSQGRFGAGEAVREHRMASSFTVGKVEGAGEQMAIRALKVELLARHLRSPSKSCYASKISD